MAWHFPTQLSDFGPSISIVGLPRVLKKEVALIEESVGWVPNAIMIGHNLCPRVWPSLAVHFGYKQVPFLLMNYDSFYSKLLGFLDDCEDWGTFSNGEITSLWKVCDSNSEALAYLARLGSLAKKKENSPSSRLLTWLSILEN
ncbi:unnamed protein product [Prunus armeniaca]